MKKILPFFFATLLSALAYYFSTGFNNAWILLWLAPIPILLYALHASFSASLCAGFIAYFLGGLSDLPYLASGMPVGYIFLWPELISCLGFVVVLLIFRWLVLYSKYNLLSNFVFAGLWTVFEFLRSIISVDGTYASLAYTQLKNLPIVQLASVTGLWGITFLVTLIPASIVLAIYYKKEFKKAGKVILVPGCLLLVSLSFGVYRLAISLPEGKVVKIGLLAINTPPRQILSPANSDKLITLQKYAKGIHMLAQKGADIISLPEEIMLLTPADKNIFLSRFAALAKNNKVHLLVGVRVLEENSQKFHNSAYLFAPNGELLALYDKQHPLLLYESDMIRGTNLAIVNTKSLGTWGISVCKDNDFINPDRAYAKHGIDILFAPALDFDIDAWVHARPAIMQGIIGNYAVARSAQRGYLSLSDSRGRIIALTSIVPSQEQTLLLAEIRLGKG